MSKKEETKWTKHICKELKKHTPIKIVPLVASARSGSGVLDRLFIHKLGMWLVEFKGCETKLTNTQIMFGKQCRLVKPCSAYVWRQVLDNPLLVILEDFDGNVLLVDDSLSVLRYMIRLLR